MSSLVKLVGMNIKEIRKAKRLTQEELAELCGLQTSYLAGVERGDRNITLQTIEKITNGLNTSPANLFNFEHISNDLDNFDKNEIQFLLMSLLENKTKEEILLILNISKGIFATFKEQ